MWFVRKRHASRGHGTWAGLLAALAIVVGVVAGAYAQPADDVAPREAPAPDRSSALAAARQMVQADVEWIAVKTGWRTVSVPQLEPKTDRELAFMFFGAAEGPDGVTPLALYGREVHVLYFSDSLTFDNLIDRSILLHELVHHMQVVNAAQPDCGEAAEAQAYRLQVLWLTEQGVADPYALLGIAQSDIDGLTCP